VQSLLALAWCALVAMAALGWGRILGWIAGRPAGPWPTTAGIGLAALVCAGGVLNLARLALAPSLVALLAVGVLAFLASLRRCRPALPAGRAARLELLLTGAIVLGAAGLAAATIAAPRVFNFHDDLQKYLGHPVRMLATGTLAAEPLSALGFETLGGQAFLTGCCWRSFPSLTPRRSTACWPSRCCCCSRRGRAGGASRPSRRRRWGPCSSPP
jgi:hypothetical protein